MAETQSTASVGRVLGSAILLGVITAVVVALVTHLVFRHEGPLSTGSTAGAAAAAVVVLSGARRRARQRRDAQAR